MYSAEQYRQMAADNAGKAQTTSDQAAIDEFKQLQRTFTDLADNAEWMANNDAKRLHAPPR